MIIAHRPLRVPPEIQVKHRKAPALKIRAENHSDLFLSRYHDEGMHAIRFPYLCYVIKGEIDIRLGIPNANGVVNRYEILNLPEHTALLIPPGILYPEGNQQLWDRTSRAVDAQMFWVQVLSTGVFCHTSRTKDGIHASENLDVFVPGQQFLLLAEMQMDELQLADSEAMQVAKNAFVLFFSRILRGLREGTKATLAQSRRTTESDIAYERDSSLVIQRACEFISKHNSKSFSVEDVAAHVYVSPSHLMRLFREELNCTVMEFTAKQRFTIAENWLINSNMSINQIARFLSYKQAPQFVRAFRRTYGVSPREYRQQHWKDIIKS